MGPTMYKWVPPKCFIMLYIRILIFKIFGRVDLFLDDNPPLAEALSPLESMAYSHSINFLILSSLSSSEFP